MGRQHTMYISDASWKKLMLLKEENESMSSVIRKSIEVATNYHIQYDAVRELEQKRVILQELQSKKWDLMDLLNDIADISLEHLHASQRLHKIKVLLEKEGYIE
tara:strand:+ start:1872 stop:2183 length:312 start_codon:yes stop_codon:yes gene_type:complete